MHYLRLSLRHLILLNCYGMVADLSAMRDEVTNLSARRLADSLLTTNHK